MQQEIIDKVVSALNSDGELGGYGLLAVNHDRVYDSDLKSMEKDFFAEVYSLGFSQTNGQGGLELYYYFGVVVRWRKPFDDNVSVSGVTIDGVTDRIVKLLHRYEVELAHYILFSKALRVYEKHTIELNTRRLTLDPQEGEEVSGVFFYVNGPYEKYYGGESSTEPGEGEPIALDPEESTGESTPQVIYVRGDAIWD